MMRPRLDSDLSDVDDLMYQNSLLLQKVYSPYVYAASRHGSIDATGMTPPHGRSFQHLSPVSPLHLPQQPPSNGQAGYYISQQGDLISDRSISPVPMYANYSHSPHHVQSGQYYLHSPTSSEVMAMPAGGYIPSGQAMGYDK